MAYPVTLNGRTYTLADFEGTNYVEGLPDAFEDFVTHAGDIYNSTSTTSNTIGTGSKTFTVESAKPYQAGTPLRIADASAPSTNFMDTIVTSYSGTTLVVDSVGYAGSGTFTSWNVNIGGAASVAGTVAIAQGGTGATTAAAARTNLDVYSKADADSRFLNVSGEASNVTMTGNVTIGDAAGDTLTVNATADFNTGFNVDGTITADGLTVSPSGTQQILATLRANSGSGGGVVLQTDASDDALFRGYDASGNIQFQFDTDGGDSYIAQGNFGIGASSPDNLLTIQTGTYANAYVPVSNIRYNAFDVLKFGFTGAGGSIRTGTIDTGSYGFAVNTGDGTERMRISSDGSCRWTPDGTTQDMTLDASGNLLVGTTAYTGNTTSAGAGFYDASGVKICFASGAGTTGVFNRLTSDGDIVQFRKDGTTVGSIGTLNADLNIGTGDTGVQFVDGSDAILPHSMTANTFRDNAISLGNAGNRFKDLYLSGGVYLGGTGSSNLLDDYEEGTWTPTYTTDGTDFSSVTYNTGVTGGKYVKVGNMVYASGTLYTSSITVGSASGTVRVGGLPFAIEASTGGTQNGYTAVALGEAANFAGDVPAMGRGVPTTTEFDLFYKTASNGQTTGLQVADLNAGSNKNLLRFTIVYVST